MVRLDTDPLQMPADADSISGERENVCIRTSLACSGGINRNGRRRSRTCCVNEVENSLVIAVLHRKSMSVFMRVNFNFPFKLGPKVGLHIIQECVL